MSDNGSVQPALTSEFPRAIEARVALATGLIRGARHIPEPYRIQLASAPGPDGVSVWIQCSQLEHVIAWAEYHDCPVTFDATFGFVKVHVQLIKRGQVVHVWTHMAVKKAMDTLWRLGYTFTEQDRALSFTATEVRTMLSSSPETAGRGAQV